MGEGLEPWWLSDSEHALPPHSLWCKTCTADCVVFALLVFKIILHGWLGGFFFDPLMADVCGWLCDCRRECGRQRVCDAADVRDPRCESKHSARGCRPRTQERCARD